MARTWNRGRGRRHIWDLKVRFIFLVRPILLQSALPSYEVFFFFNPSRMMPSTTSQDSMERPVGTNTTWMREIEGNPEFVAGWNEQIKNQRVRKAVESQAIDLTTLASTPMHDRLNSSAPRQ
jgi:hypothetical protein